MGRLVTACRHRWRTWKYRRDEWFDIVNPRGYRTGRAPRTLCHSGRPGYLHSVVHLHIITSDGSVVLQKRAAGKCIQPGKWDTAVGGHLAAGETVGEALIREAREETGMVNFTPVPVRTYIWKTPVEQELVYMFYSSYRGPLAPDKEEIDELRIWSPEEVERSRSKEIFTPNFIHEYTILLREGIIGGRGE